MTKTEGRFSQKNEAENAKNALIQSGIDADAIHIWNILDGDSTRRSNVVEGGAVIGGAIGGISGLLGGAALGDSYDDNSHLPLPSGVRVVVEHDANFDAQSVLKTAGATQIRTL